MKALIGLKAGNQPCYLDLHENIMDLMALLREQLVLENQKHCRRIFCH